MAGFGHLQESHERRADQLPQALEVKRTHLGIKPLRVLARQGEQAESAVGAQRDVGIRFQQATGLAEPLRGFEHDLVAAIRLTQAVREYPDFLAAGLEFWQRRVVPLAPQPNCDVGHREIFPANVVENLQQAFQVSRFDHCQRGAMHALTYGVIFFAELHQFAQFRFQHLVLLAQRDDLAFGDRDGPAAMRVRYRDFPDHIREILEKLGMVLQVTGNVFRSHAFLYTSISPSNTDCAGPVIETGCASPVQDISSTPPRVSTLTGESSCPRAIPATTAAQAPVPQDRVSPAPRSYTRSLI